MSQFSKSGKEILGYVVREGKERGKGRYVGSDTTWTDHVRAHRWRVTHTLNLETVKAWARSYAKNVAGGRVVTIVRREKLNLCCDCGVRERDIARADLARMTEQRDALREQCQRISQLAQERDEKLSKIMECIKGAK